MGRGRERGVVPGAWRGCARGLLLAAALVPAALAASPAATPAGSGVEGLTALRGELTAGVVVLAFAEAGPGPSAAPLAVSSPTDKDGRYRLELKPGSYHLVAVKSSGRPWPFADRPGDLFCYYLGNPIVVEPGKLSRVGFNLVKVGERPAPSRDAAAGIAGRVLFEGKPLGRAYVHLYRDAASNFRGMGMASVPTDDQGRFRMKLPPGRYYVLARKRQGGGMYGPPGKDDHVGYFPGNPVEVKPGELTPVALETATRVDLLDETWFAESERAGWFEGTVNDAAGAPVGGLYVLFYQDPAMTGTPAFVAGPTDAEGRFKVRAALGAFHLLARSALGGPVEAGEWYGKSAVTGGKDAPGEPGGGRIRIVVSRFKGQGTPAGGP